MYGYVKKNQRGIEMNSDKRVQLACNRFLIYGMLLGGFFAWMAVDYIQEGTIGAGIGSGVVALGVIVIVLLLMPWGYRFDQKGITICYLLLPSERSWGVVKTTHEKVATCQ